MKLHGIYAERPALFQILILLLLALLGSSISAIISVVIFTGNITATPDTMRLTQLIAALGMFLFPSFGAAYLFSNNTRIYLSIRKIPETKILLLTFLSIFLISPLIGITTIINQQMVLPSFMEPIENWMKAQEVEIAQLTKLLLEEKGITALLYNLFIIAVIAGITEEFLFRGAIQRISEKWFNNHHTIIWTTAFLFSAIHIQFYGIIPRMLLGAYFGYLLYWSKNIYIPIFAHFTYNSLGIITMSNPVLSENKILSENATLPDLLPFAITGTIFFFFCVRELKRIFNSKIFLS